jgi:hypothetical protein
MDLQATGSGSQWPVCPILVNSSTHACSEFSKLGIQINGMCVKMLTNLLTLPFYPYQPFSADPLIQMWISYLRMRQVVSGHENFESQKLCHCFVDKSDFIFYICLVLVHFLPSSPFNLNKTAQCHLLCLFILDVTPHDLPPIHPKWHAKEFYRPW